MRCFELLVKNLFLENALSELKHARFVIMGPLNPLPASNETTVDNSIAYFYPLTLPAKKKVFENIWEEFGMDNFLNDPENDDLDDEFSLCYMESDLACLIYSRDPLAIQESILYNYNLSGELPFYRTEKLIEGVMHYFVITVRTLPFTPFSVN